MSHSWERELNGNFMLLNWLSIPSIGEHKRASWSYRGWGVCLVEEFVNTKAMVVRFFIHFLMQIWFPSHISVILISHVYVTGFLSHYNGRVNNFLVAFMFLFFWHVCRYTGSSSKHYSRCLQHLGKVFIRFVHSFVLDLNHSNQRNNFCS